jgi:hypothetical protein
MDTLYEVAEYHVENVDPLGSRGRTWAQRPKFPET